MPEKFLIRDSIDSDIPLITNSYYKTITKSLLGRLHLPTVVEYRVNQIIQSRIISAKSKVATHPEDTNVILGIIVYENDICHLIYTKSGFRRGGIATALWNEVPGLLRYSAYTGEGSEFAKSLDPKPILDIAALALG